MTDRTVAELEAEAGKSLVEWQKAREAHSKVAAEYFASGAVGWGEPLPMPKKLFDQEAYERLKVVSAKEDRARKRWEEALERWRGALDRQRRSN